MIDVTVMGTVKRRQALTRRGARPGDDLYVSGTIGAAAAGLRILQERRTLATDKDLQRSTTQDTGNTEARTDQKRDCSSVSSMSSVVERSKVESCIARYLRPEPRLRLGIHLGRNGAASACMDLSDGLADGLRQIADASGVGMTIDADALPIAPGARAFFETRGQDPVVEALSGGDDYELLIAVRPRTERRLTAAMRRGDVMLTRIGRCTTERGITLRTAGAASIDVGALPHGFSHFR
jgi:thiamine-monophosphate kinase